MIFRKTLLCDGLLLLFAAFLCTEQHISCMEIAAEDLAEVQTMASYLFKGGNFGYTLWCDKPISFTSMRDRFDPPQIIAEFLGVEAMVGYVFFCFHPTGSTIFHAWDLFHKYLEKCSSTTHFLVKKDCDLWIVNKKATRGVIERHLEKFQAILGQEFHPDVFLEELENSEKSPYALVKHHFGLMGILLGYGTRNSNLFQERVDLEERLANIDWAVNYTEWLAVQKRLDEIATTLNGRFPIGINLIRPCHPQYVCDAKHPESMALDQKYREQSGLINEILDSPDWMERMFGTLSAQ